MIRVFVGCGAGDRIGVFSPVHQGIVYIVKRCPLGRDGLTFGKRVGDSGGPAGKGVAGTGGLGDGGDGGAVASLEGRNEGSSRRVEGEYIANAVVIHLDDCAAVRSDGCFLCRCLSDKARVVIAVDRHRSTGGSM